MIHYKVIALFSLFLSCIISCNNVQRNERSTNQKDTPLSLFESNRLNQIMTGYVDYIEDHFDKVLIDIDDPVYIWIDFRLADNKDTIMEITTQQFLSKPLESKEWVFQKSIDSCIVVISDNKKSPLGRHLYSVSEKGVAVKTLVNPPNYNEPYFKHRHWIYTYKNGELVLFAKNPK